jgi:hypothetical protein
MILGVNWVNLRVAPTHDFNRPNVLADEIAGNFYAVTAQIDDRAAAR